MKGSYDIPVSTNVQRRYNRWKFFIPLIYDWLLNHNLYWPSLSCRWGPQLDETSNTKKQRLYLTEQTDDASAPNTLIIADSEIVKPRVATEDIRKFNEDERSPNIKKNKAIIHPGEVNIIREMPQNNNLLATHSDRPEESLSNLVLIWDIDAQPARHAIPGAEHSIPNLKLIGHTDDAQFALEISAIEPYVLSGGKDMNVVLWNVNDHITYLAAASNLGPRTHHVPSVFPRGTYRGHTNTVEDVEFCPTSAQEFCSVGDDSTLILWDARVGPDPVIKVEEAHHEDDIHCVEWNNFDVNYILTGSADRSVHMYDRRNLNNGRGQNPVYTFQGHDAAVLCVQWCPEKPSVFGTSGDDGIVNIWDHEKVGRASSSSAGLREERTPPGLFFRHVGHRQKVVEFQWNPSDPWTIVSLSNDCRGRGGGTLQMWRMLDIIHEEDGNEERKMAELNRLRPWSRGLTTSFIRDLSFSFY
ncbi:WD-40 repeat-containing protein MSI4-like [Prosopis cineraria]|uniref:WD-40 repeat-containing protein MSI4-like n=1 Tax=Prosopis cineraria TaxID=364024 RepID=UPI00240FA730|nr:WD-40 repeat-containing protein MSI4-like [Prosopis cineraria]